MRAVTTTGFGGPEVMTLGEVPMPTLRPCDVLVRVRAAGVNRADVLQRQGKYPPPAGCSSVLGLEFAGEVVNEAHSWPAGARVMGILSGGGYAEYAAVHHLHLLPIPDSLSFETAAAIPEVWLTAFQLTHFIGSLAPGKRVLIHAAASGVGTTLIQLVREAGGIALATCGSQAKATYCLDEWVQPDKADLILDPVLGSYFSQNIASLNLEGKWVVYGTLGGTLVDKVDFSKLLAKRASLEFTTLRTRSDEYKAELSRRFLSEGVVEKISKGQFQPIVHSVLSWREVQEAHRVLETSENIGKVVLKID